ncbi:hypothetical protein [Chitinivorax sp. B]|uniref:hypothetical protein n=1 Tax=Chitinivorax sp. B TaxID=2502235 RepID=UPI0010F4BA86|nr:hypothetical protein [Chitinivorax sp. B]
MSTTVAIGRMQSKLHVPADQLTRAQAVQQLLLDDTLEPRLHALAPDDELVLIRRVALPLTLSASHTDWQAAQLWGDAIARAIQCELDRCGGDGIVRFRHPAAALQTMAECAWQHDDRLDWAWRRLAWLPAGVVSASQRRDAVFAQLRAQPAWVVPMLQGWRAESLLLPRLLALAAYERQELLIALYGAHGTAISAQWSAMAELLACCTQFDQTAAQAEKGTSRWSSRPRFPWGHDWQVALSQQPATQAAVLAAIHWVLDQPMLLCRPAAALQAKVMVTLQAVRRGNTASDVVPRKLQLAKQPAVQSAAEPTPNLSPAADDLATWPALAKPVCGETEYGGLLLISPLLESSGALATLTTSTHPPLPAMLTWLATVLVPMLPARDPARLAFAGLAPDAELPLDWRAPCPPDCLESLLRARHQLWDSLAIRIPPWSGPGLIEQLARRHALIRVEPGWIDVCYRLSDVCLDIRRAGLDLDPGYLPWLGLVMRYCYA